MFLLVCSLGEVKSAPIENSIFFFPEEIAALLESRRHNSPSSDQDLIDNEESSNSRLNAPRYIHLSAILIHGNGQFEIWMNGVRYDRLRHSKYWDILDVNHRQVYLKMSQGEAIGQIVRIAINQTVDLQTGQMIEGQPPFLQEKLSLAPKRVR